MSSYGWIIDVDHLAESPGDSRIGTIGPRGIPKAIQEHFQRGRFPLAAQRWRCRDCDGNVYYEGRYIGPDDDRMFAPLEDFCLPDAGASDIEYLHEATGAWRSI